MALMSRMQYGVNRLVEHLHQRIQTLEHALDQALLVIEDLRNQRRDQQFLENQLIETEEFAHIQYKATQELKRQLRETRLELSEVRRLAEQQIGSLHVLEAEMAAANTTQESLEEQASHHARMQATLQQQCRELEVEYDRQQTRIQELEHQLVELQEQILHQAQQAREYEAAVRHWKHRCHTIRELVSALQNGVNCGQTITAADLDPILAHLPDNLNLDDDVLKTVAPLPVQRDVDLPGFLVPTTSHYVAQ